MKSTKLKDYPRGTLPLGLVNPDGSVWRDFAFGRLNAQSLWMLQKPIAETARRLPDGAKLEENVNLAGFLTDIATMLLSQLGPIAQPTREMVARLSPFDIQHILLEWLYRKTPLQPVGGVCGVARCSAPFVGELDVGEIPVLEPEAEISPRAIIVQASGDTPKSPKREEPRGAWTYSAAWPEYGIKRATLRMAESKDDEDVYASALAGGASHLLFLSRVVLDLNGNGAPTEKDIGDLDPEVSTALTQMAKHWRPGPDLRIDLACTSCNQITENGSAVSLTSYFFGALDLKGSPSFGGSSST